MNGHINLGRLDEVMCGIPRVECVDVSWTRHIDRSQYWDDKHFRAGVYNKIADQIIRTLAGNSSSGGSWSFTKELARGVKTIAIRFNILRNAHHNMNK